MKMIKKKKTYGKHPNGVDRQLIQIRVPHDVGSLRNEFFCGVKTE